MSDRPPGVGPGFQHDTKYWRDRQPRPCEWVRPTAPFKRHENPLAVIELPAPQVKGGEPLWTVIGQRRSVRKFRPEPLGLQALSQLLWAIQGVTATSGPFLLRTCASAGALYPNETYLVLNNVEGVGPGIAHYQVGDHSLALLKQGEFGPACAQACLGQSFCASAPVVFAWDAVVHRCAQKYGDRAYRYIYLDAGHLGAQLQLAAVGLGLGSVNIGAFLDDEVNRLFDLDGVAETIIYLTAVGAPR